MKDISYIFTIEIILLIIVICVQVYTFVSSKRLIKKYSSFFPSNLIGDANKEKSENNSGGLNEDIQSSEQQEKRPDESSTKSPNQ